MNIKQYFGKIFDRFLVGNLLAMAVVVILLIAGAGFGLSLYTHHGEGIEVPRLEGTTFEQAYRQLEALGLGLVVSDSGYNKKQPANTILAQTPGPGQKVKQGHIIYVTVNSPSSPTFALPDIVDNSSLREAEARLTAMGFQLTKPLLIDGEKDWVYGILCRGRRVAGGDRLSVDYPLTLMVGRGTYDESDSIEYLDPTDVAPADGGTTDYMDSPNPLSTTP